MIVIDYERLIIGVPLLSFDAWANWAPNKRCVGLKDKYIDDCSIDGRIDDNLIRRCTQVASSMINQTFNIKVWLFEKFDIFFTRNKQIFP